MQNVKLFLDLLMRFIKSNQYYFMLHVKIPTWIMTSVSLSFLSWWCYRYQFSFSLCTYSIQVRINLPKIYSPCLWVRYLSTNWVGPTHYLWHVWLVHYVKIGRDIFWLQIPFDLIAGINQEPAFRRRWCKMFSP